MLLAAFAAAASESDEFEPDIVDMRPVDRANWSPRNLSLPLRSLFVGGLDYYYEPRELLVDTTPSGAIVDFFYIRSNFQKLYEQGQTPLTVILPPRAEALDRDAIRIRALAPGHRQQSVTFKVNSRRTEVILDLEPLPNQLQAVAHRYFAGRGSLTFLTSEQLAPRLQQESGGFAVFLAESGMSEAAAASLSSIENAIVAESFGQQLGEDLAVRITLQPEYADAIELRSRQSYDAPRDLHVFAVDLVPSDGGAAAVGAALAALSKLDSSDVTGCRLRFDERLRAQLDAGSLSRALEPRGEFTDRYVRAAMKRMGEAVPGGVIEFIDGSRYDPSIPIELDAALSQAGSAIGFLAILRSFSEHLEGEYADEALRSLVAPEQGVAGFGEQLDAARAAERSCLAAS